MATWFLARIRELHSINAFVGANYQSTRVGIQRSQISSVLFHRQWQIHKESLLPAALNREPSTDFKHEVLKKISDKNGNKVSIGFM